MPVDVLFVICLQNYMLENFTTNCGRKIGALLIMKYLLDRILVSVTILYCTFPLNGHQY